MKAATTTCKPVAPSRISDADALALYRECSIHELGRRAHQVTTALHPETHRTYVVDRNINYANYCTAKCIFCSFQADPPGMNSGRSDLSEGYVLSLDQIGKKIEELLEIGGTQVLMQGGLVPAEILPFDWYLEMLRFIKRDYPTIHIHAFSPPELFAFEKIFDMPVRDVILRLRDAGLDSIPGGGGEILVDRVRDKIGVGKTRTQEFLYVMRQAHSLGMKTSATMMFGHIETLAERIETLRCYRDLQDETGGFTAFICWTFQPGDTPLGRVKPFPIAYDGEPDGKHLMLADANEYLKTLAIARIYLDNIPNVQSSWVTQGPKIGQLALFFGANDMGSVMMEENVVSSAGTTYELNEEEIRSLITDAGWIPRKRTFYYDLLDD